MSEKQLEKTPNIDDFFKFSHGHRVRYDEVDAQGIVALG